MAIGVPASPIPSPSPSPSQPSPSAFPGSFGQQYGGLGRGTVGMSEATSNTSVPQVNFSLICVTLQRIVYVIAN